MSVFRELTRTKGTGDVALSGRAPGAVAWAGSGKNGQNVRYSITENGNVEIGTGLYSGNILQRSAVQETIYNGVHTTSGATPIPLDGGAVVDLLVTNEVTIRKSAFGQVFDVETEDPAEVVVKARTSPGGGVEFPADVQEAIIAIAGGEGSGEAHIKTADLANTTDPAKGVGMVGRGVVAVESIADLLALPSGQRREDLRYLVKGYHAGSGLGGGSFHWDSTSAVSSNGGTILAVSGVAQGRFIRLTASVLSPEMFGARSAATASENATALSACLNALKDGEWLVQESPELTSNSAQKTVGSSNNVLHLRLRAGGAVGSGLLRLVDSPGVEVNGSIDVAGNQGIGVYLLRCSRANLPKSLWTGNIQGDQTIAVGVFTRDCDDCNIACTIENVYSANAAARGVMVSDQTIPKNTSHIHPSIKNIRSDNLLLDADGLYAESTASPYSGGLRVEGGNYYDCQKRYIQLNVPSPIVTNNMGRNSLATPMFTFISSYDLQAGFIGNNDMEALSGCEYFIESYSVDSLNVGPNRFISKTTIASSRFLNISGRIGFLQASVGQCVGVEMLLKNSGNASDVGQHLVLLEGQFDNGAASRNAIEVTGDFSKLKVADIECIHAISSKFFLSAPNLSDNIAELIDNRQEYSFGRISGTKRELQGWEKVSVNTSRDRVVNGRKIIKRDSTPTSGTYRAGDLVDKITLAVDGSNMVLTGWVCVTPGEPGTWAELRSSTVSPAT